MSLSAADAEAFFQARHAGQVDRAGKLSSGHLARAAISRVGRPFET